MYRAAHPASNPHITRARAFAVTALVSILTAASVAATPLVFDTPVSFPAGGAPRQIALADMNHDGITDLVVANGNTHSVSIFRGNGAGGFLPRQDFDCYGNPSSVAVGDINGDGIPDVAVALPDWNYVAVLPGTSTALLGAYALTYTHSFTTSVAVADLNQSGPVDVAVSENEFGAVDILFSNNSNNLVFSSYTVTGAAPRAVVGGDLNGDGRTDLVIANSGSNTITVILATGTGNFSAKTNYSTGTTPLAAAIGDLNGDGKPDIAVANSGSNTVSVFLNNGTGGFGPKTDFVTGSVPASVAIADVGGNGTADLVVANSGASSVSILEGNGDGTFAAKTDVATGGSPTGGSPTCVVLADVNGDDRLDLLTSNATDNTISLIPQLPNLPLTSTTLSLSSNPSTYGQSITMSSTVTPSDATGEVRFYDGILLLGSAPVVSGSASFTTAALRHGDHAITARYGGSAVYRTSVSSALTQTVNLAPTTTAITAGTIPGYFRLPLRFTATVSRDPSIATVPAGAVQFAVDGVALGAPAAMTAGSATSPSISTLPLGTHQVVATYVPADTFFFTGSVSPPFVESVLPSTPSIVKVRDVPNDQGGNVFITWHCPLDQPGGGIVTGYRIWRRIPASSPGLARVARAAMTGLRAARPDSLNPETFWEAVADLPSAQLVSYGYTAHTPQDSIAGSNPYTAFFVQALTTTPTEVFASPPDSGYSVDNLSPPVPSPFAATFSPTSNVLHWGSNPAADLGEFRLYRGSGTDFVPGPENLVIATRDTGYTDRPGDAYYKLIAFDIHGNPSRVAMVTPISPTAALASLVGIDAQATHIAVTWFSGGNPSLPATVYRRTLDTPWQPLGSILADGSGYLRFDDAEVVTGIRYGYRLGVMDAGAETFVGEAWATASQPIFALERITPNPSPSGRLGLDFVLANSERATLELFDVSGRRVAAAEVGSLGSGRHHFELGAGQRLAPGVYLLRFSQGGTVFHARAAVLN